MEKILNNSTPELISLKKHFSRSKIKPGLKSMNILNLKPKDPLENNKKNRDLSHQPKIAERNNESTSTKNSKSFSIKLPTLDKSSIMQIKKKVEIKRNIFKNTNSTNNLINALINTEPVKKSKRLTFYSISRTGSIEGKSKNNNQDAKITIQQYLNKYPASLFGVLDGHGPNGHLVSRFLENEYQEILKKYLLSIPPCTAEEQTKKVFCQVIKEVMNNLKSTGIDILYSGSTLLSVLLYENECICASVGDSRGIIGELDKNWTVKVLNKEHKPNDPIEKKRIEDSGGRVGCVRNSAGKSIGPIRAWGSSSNSPGLAMSRTLGDLFAESFGVISEPGNHYIDVKIFNLTQHDKFLVLATDGLWDALSNIQVVEIVKKYWENSDAVGAADKLLLQAVRASELNGGYVDDITIIVIFRC